jgi:hypothetical protein
MPIELKDSNISGLEIQMEVILLTRIKTGMHSDSSNCTVICMLWETWGFGSMNAKILAVGHLILEYFASLRLIFTYLLN